MPSKTSRAIVIGTLAVLFSGCAGGTNNEATTGEYRALEAETAAPAAETAPAAASEPTGAAAEPAAGLVMSDDPCSSDADCVKGECCHARTCVARSKAPSCEGVMCTMDCRAGTTDCGGGCVCSNGRCAAKLAGPPPILRDPIPPTAQKGQAGSAR